MLFDTGHESLVCEAVAPEDVLVVVVDRVVPLDVVLALTDDAEVLLLADDDDDEDTMPLEVDDELVLVEELALLEAPGITGQRTEFVSLVSQRKNFVNS